MLSGRRPLHRSEDDRLPLSRGHFPSVLSPPPRLALVSLLGPFIPGSLEWALDANFLAGQRNEQLPRPWEGGHGAREGGFQVEAERKGRRARKGGWTPAPGDWN